MHDEHPHERRFSGDANRLRAPERVARLDVERVVALALEGTHVTSALDVGTGTGVFAQAFAGLGIAVTGLDANAGLLAIARDLVPAAAFREGTAEELPFPDRSFDLVFLGLVLHETDDAVAALREARRVAGVRVTVLEWPYLEEEHGPPLAHRLDGNAVRTLATAAGFASVDAIKLDHVDLYRLTP